MATIPSRKFSKTKKKIASRVFPKSQSGIPSSKFAKGTAGITSRQMSKAPVAAKGKQAAQVRLDRPTDEKVRRDWLATMMDQANALKSVSEL